MLIEILSAGEAFLNVKKSKKVGRNKPARLKFFESHEDSRSAQ